jgi:chromosome segregation ATPase
VDRLKTSEAQLNAQAKAHKAEVEDLKKKLAEMNENFEVAKAKQEISEMETARVQKNIEELRDSKEKCYEVSMNCVKKLKDSFAKVGACALIGAKIYPRRSRRSYSMDRRRGRSFLRNTQ